MRKKLAKYIGKKITVIGTFVRSDKENNKGYFFANIICNGEIITDHIWIKSREFLREDDKDKLNPSQCRRLFAITGTVKTYKKLNKKGEKVLDYCLTSVIVERKLSVTGTFEKIVSINKDYVTLSFSNIKLNGKIITDRVFIKCLYQYGAKIENFKNENGSLFTIDSKIKHLKNVDKYGNEYRFIEAIAKIAS